MTRQGLCIALAAMTAFLCAAASASADLVGNPGSFSASFTGALTFGGLTASGSTVTTFSDLHPLELTGSVDKNGAITGDAPANAIGQYNLSDASIQPGGGVTINLSQQRGEVRSGSPTGELDPDTGEANLLLPLWSQYAANVSVSIMNPPVSGTFDGTVACFVGVSSSAVEVPLTTAGTALVPTLVAGVPYDDGDGSLTLATDGPFDSPDPACNISLPSDVSNVYGSTIIGLIHQELVGSGQGQMWLTGAFSPAFTAPAPPPPPPTGGGSTPQPPPNVPSTPSAPAAPRKPAQKKCVVPRLGHGTLASVRRKLRHAHCKLGKVKRAHSKKIKKGRVISQGRKPGKKLKSGSAINVTVSTGAARKRRAHHH